MEEEKKKVLKSMWSLFKRLYTSGDGYELRECNRIITDVLKTNEYYYIYEIVLEEVVEKLNKEYNSKFINTLTKYMNSYRKDNGITEFTTEYIQSRLDHLFQFYTDILEKMDQGC